jgi:nucleoside-diphosphate-sugar epimerase
MGRWGNAFFEYVKLHDDGSAVIDLYGDPNRKMPAIHVGDLAAAYVMAAQNINAVAGEEFVLGMEGPAHTWEEVQRRVAELMGATPAKIVVSVREPATPVESFRNFTGTSKFDKNMGFKFFCSPNRRS